MECRVCSFKMVDGSTGVCCFDLEDFLLGLGVFNNPESVVDIPVQWGPGKPKSCFECSIWQPGHFDVLDGLDSADFGDNSVADMLNRCI